MIKRLFTFLVLNSILVTSAFAFKLSPMNLYFGPQKKNLRKIVTLSNARNKGKVAIKLSVTMRAIDKSGKETRVPTDDIGLFPRQVILKPGAVQNIRVTYKGDIKKKTEIAYRLIAQQLPIKDYIEEQSTGIKILLKYAAAVYFTPKKARSKLKLISYGNKKIVIKNIGQKHLIIKNIKFLDKNNKIIFENPKEIVGINLLSQSERVFSYSKEASGTILKDLQVKVNY